MTWGHPAGTQGSGGGTVDASLQFIDFQLAWCTFNSSTTEDPANILSTGSGVDFADAGGGVISATSDSSATKDGLREGASRRAPLATIATELGIPLADIADGTYRIMCRLTPQIASTTQAIFHVGIADDDPVGTMNGAAGGYKVAGGGMRVGTTLAATNGSNSLDMTFSDVTFFIDLRIQEPGATNIQCAARAEIGGKEYAAANGASVGLGTDPDLNFVLFVGVDTSGATVAAHQVRVELAAVKRESKL